MAHRSSLKARSTLCSLFLFATTILGHIEMSWPYALRSKYNPMNTDGHIDYSNTSPLQSDGSNFPCKGYQNDRPVQTVTTYAAGSTYNLTLSGSATHEGGSCQVSLSYDNGATFRVIKSMIGGCPLTETYNFTVPSYAPSGEALLAWTWQNKVGNREFYMSCAEVNVMSGAYTGRKRQAFNSFDSLPLIWKANLGGLNDCTTTEGDDPVYPNSGPDVVYGDGLSSTSPPSPGTCDSATPYGQTYKYLGDGAVDADNSTAVPSNSSTSTNTSSAVATTSQAYTVQNTQSSATSDLSSAQRRQITAAPLSPANYPLKKAIARSATTVFVDCDYSVTITVFPEATVRSPSMVTSTTRRPSTTGGSAIPPSNTRPAYATGDVNARYLPCVPGTFLCSSKTTFLTCNYNDGTVNSDETWVYSSRQERTVAAGMECLPMLAPYSGSTEEYTQQGATPAGGYRDDRYIRARPNGDCDSNGSLQCTAGGSQFMTCDQGGWIDMGSVAAGTTCSNGKIVAS